MCYAGNSPWLASSLTAFLSVGKSSSLLLAPLEGSPFLVDHAKFWKSSPEFFSAIITRALQR